MIGDAPALTPRQFPCLVARAGDLRDDRHAVLHRRTAAETQTEPGRCDDDFIAIGDRVTWGTSLIGLESELKPTIRRETGPTALEVRAESRCGNDQGKEKQDE